VLDIKMPDMTGLERQQLLLDKGVRLPVIMISGYATVRTAVEVMSKGAVTLLEKPFSMQELISHVRRAMEQDRSNRAAQNRQVETGARLASLTPREREVLELIAAGKTNKEMASGLELSLRAVEDRRARLMRKLKVRSVAELVLLASGQGALQSSG
jgi:FixJ family two-component response regulator